jgi:hypothetical protein
VQRTNREEAAMREKSVDMINAAVWSVIVTISVFALGILSLV